ncbi:KaiB domain protein [Rippkaea orientalis PCC 8801]|uniref:KaiB domain protein n=1 Tax=Rippkaea orientalis (strain PCC 8801 / RF-1) TaxID=41431 RepID=B7K5P6_RIPO1|nr:circadian clock KaiB family protein [Rippkaea orientalis]ACK66779.1 KaiB domain protein [Rippkaea orientalis PCC 8801]
MVLPEIFKGIALFTPGGDLVYCYDRRKQLHWHSHLCVALQELLHLPEPPHFLIPGYTATVDRWFCANEKQVKTLAELYPPLKRYQPLLNAVFEVEDLLWQTADWIEEACNPIILETYRAEFPQLWENHDLIVCLSGDRPQEPLTGLLWTPTNETETPETHQGYILRLFVAGNSATTKQTLQTIHQLLEQELQHPYTLKLVDISKHPEEAEIHQVSATPSLVRVWPKPVRRIVGELEDLPRVLQLITT